MVAGVPAAGEIGLFHRVSIAVKPLPQLADGQPRCRMHNLGGNLSQRPQHIRPLYQVRPRQRHRRLRTYNVVIQKHIEVHTTRSPAWGVAWPTAQAFYGVQMRYHLAQRERRLKPNNPIDKVVTLESDRAVPIPGRETGARKHTRQLCGSLGDILLGIDITPDGNVDVRHGLARKIRARALDGHANVA